MAAIELESVTDRVGDTVAVSNLDLAVRSGEVSGFPRRDGTGKTMAIDLLLDVSRSTEWGVTVPGLDVGTESVAVRDREGSIDALDRNAGDYSRGTTRLLGLPSALVMPFRIVVPPGTGV